MIGGSYKVVLHTLSRRPGYSSGRCIDAAMTGRSRAADTDYEARHKSARCNTSDSPMLHPRATRMTCLICCTIKLSMQRSPQLANGWQLDVGTTTAPTQPGPLRSVPNCRPSSNGAMTGAKGCVHGPHRWNHLLRRHHGWSQTILDARGSDMADPRLPGIRSSLDTRHFMRFQVANMTGTPYS